MDIEPDDAQAAGPWVMPGFVDVHVHGWAGNDAMGGRAALDGMSRALLRAWRHLVPADRRDVAACRTWSRSRQTVRDWMPDAPPDGARPLGFNIEGPFISDAKRGAHNPALVRSTRRMSTWTRWSRSSRACAS